MYLADVYSTLPNLTYTPAITLPSLLSSEDLPVGIQLIAKPMHDFRLLAIAQQLQNYSEYHLQQPSILQK